MEKTPAERIEAVLERLLKIYGVPEWRHPLPAVDELVSTILSQNTNDVNRDKAFNALKSRFADWDAVRTAAEETVIDAIRIAGLANQKGPRIQAVLNQINSEVGSLDLSFLAALPVEDARAWLIRFKGVGFKTAAIVLLFALDRPAFPVDTHIYRVTGRLGVHPEKLDLEKTHRLLEEIIDPAHYFAGHLNLIRLGRETCHARKPECAACPVLDLCAHPQLPVV